MKLGVSCDRVGVGAGRGEKVSPISSLPPILWICSSLLNAIKELGGNSMWISCWEHRVRQWRGENKQRGKMEELWQGGKHGNWEKDSHRLEVMQTQISHLSGFSYFQKIKNKGDLGRKLVLQWLDFRKIYIKKKFMAVSIKSNASQSFFLSLSRLYIHTRGKDFEWS